MTRTLFGWVLVALAGALVIGCGDDDVTSRPTPDGGTDDTGRPVVRCSSADDPDTDSISTGDDGLDDRDGDGRPNFEDTDSDGDDILDRDEAGDSNCNTPPSDSDDDGQPDFLDLDSNADGIADGLQLDDTDGDGVLDAHETDLDGDNISNVIEAGEDAMNPIDTDGDGTPDLRDLDSDGDFILDQQESADDRDMDGIPNFRDLDSDGDGIDDATEGGDSLLDTPATACRNEENADGYADYLDLDSDNDGLSDAEERELGTRVCGLDTDDDGQDDLVEAAFERVNCIDGTGDACGCAVNEACTIPPDDYFVVLPFRGERQLRELQFGTNVRVADVFFLTDTTGSMGGVLTNVKATVATPGIGLIDRISEVIPDAWYGGGQHDDFPFGSYGGPPDEPFILASVMRPPAERAMVQTAFNAIALHGGGDGPESPTEAIYQVLTGEGGTWTGSAGFGGGGTYTMPAYGGSCLDTGFGAACFRDGALPVIVLFTDICSHAGPPGESPSCDPYVAIDPAPHLYEDMIRVMNARGARFVGINSSGSRCPAVTVPADYSPCYFMRRTAEDSGSIDVDGNPLVYDLPSSGGTTTEFTDIVVDAIQRIATRVPFDVDTALRNDPANPSMVDATRFIKSRRPGCRATPAIEPCWVAADGTRHEDAVAAVDDSTFFGVIPGTLVTFQIAFHNDFYQGGTTAQVFVAYVDVRADGFAVLDTRQVYIVVPSAGGILPI